MDYDDWIRPRLVSHAAELLQKELKSKRRVDRVHLSLATDPFMVGWPEVSDLSCELIRQVNRVGIPCAILTKGVYPSSLASEPTRHRDNLYGISLVSCDESFRESWEPGASSFVDRISGLRALHLAGCKTRAHIEPYPTPNLHEQDVVEVLESVSFVDQLYLGGWNYLGAARNFATRRAFYESQRELVRRFCVDRGILFENDRENEAPPARRMEPNGQLCL